MSSELTINQIILLLHVHVDGNTENIKQFNEKDVHALEDRELLVENVGGSLTVADRGLVLIRHMKTLPLPVKAWVMP